MTMIGRSPSSRPAAADVRAAYERGLRGLNPSPGEMGWRLSRFDHGLSLVSEIECAYGSLASAIVADLGAAHGGDSCALLTVGARAIAVDYVDHGYSEMRRSLRRVGAHLDVVFADVTRTLPFRDGSLNGVVAMNLIEHVVDRTAFLHDISRVLAPGGVALVTAPLAWTHIGRDPFYGLPLIAVLPMKLRCLVAEEVFRRKYPFRLRGQTCYSSARVVALARRAGLLAEARKYSTSALMRRVKSWPLHTLWTALIERYGFDFILLRKPRAS